MILGSFLLDWLLILTVKSEMQIKMFIEQTLNGHYQISCCAVYIMRDLYFNQFGTNVRQSMMTLHSIWKILNEYSTKVTVQIFSKVRGLNLIRLHSEVLTCTLDLELSSKTCNSFILPWYFDVKVDCFSRSSLYRNKRGYSNENSINHILWDYCASKK